MAGYKAADGIYINATLINTQADLPEGQRDKFSQSNGGKGAANKAVLDSMFQHEDNLVGNLAEAQMDIIVNNFKDLDLEMGPNENPDFLGGVRLDYQDGMTEFGPDGSVNDKPNELGPNLHVPAVDTFLPSTGRDVQVSPELLENEDERGGYGFKIDRNTRQTSVREELGTYFKRFYNEPDSSPQLGEFVDTDDLSY